MADPFDPSIPGARTRPFTRDETAGPLCLVVTDRSGVTVHPLPAAGRVVLGRLDRCEVPLNDPTISRHHAALETGPRLRITDLGSANGVFVRGARIAPNVPVEIEPGEVLEVGALTLWVRHGEPSESAAGAPAQRATVVPPRGPALVVRAPAMRKLFDLVDRVATSELPVLLTGETGVGKEVVAEAVHAASHRATSPLLRLNCAALSETLLESEIFGHEKGSFTGATVAKPGLLESADGGTVFLDEVGELPARLQAKLLRVLEERAVLRVGALKPRTVDVRFVAATNRDLRLEVERGAFRRDLYFRLNGITLTIPPLRARTEEIDELSRFFLARRDPSAAGISPEAMALLRAYLWPGNIRELRNAIERAALLAGPSPILPEHLPAEISGTHDLDDAGPPPSLVPGTAAARTGSLRDEREDFERQRVLRALEACEGNQTRAAEMLGLSRRALVARLATLDVPRPRKKSPPRE